MGEPVTTTWTFSVAAPTASTLLQIGIESAANPQGDVVTLKSEQSGDQVFSLCRELRALQTALGVTYKEDGRVQVQVDAADAAGHTLLDHTYEHSIFNGEADFPQWKQLLDLIDPPVLGHWSAFAGD